jgi:hypothetical protein
LPSTASLVLDTATVDLSQELSKSVTLPNKPYRYLTSVELLERFDRIS